MVDQIILEEGDRDRLIKEVCDSLVKTQGYFNAWIALLDRSGRFTTFAEAGLGEKFSALAEQLEGGRLTSCGESALTQAKAVVINDPASSCTDCPLAKEYIGRGGITARIQYRGKLYGLLCASVPASLITVAEERSLFKDVAGDIAFALRKIEVEEEREHAEWALRAYARRAISAQEEERRRVARELHDGTAQDLASLGMDIDSLARTEGLTVKDISKGLEMLRDRTDDILRGVRSLSHGLRPPMLEEFGLMVALQGLIDDLATQSGVDAKFEVRGTPRRLSPEVEITLFRIAQEGLNNIGKHAWATRAILEVEFKRDRTRLRIRDNGQGFALPASLDDLGGSDTLGLVGMRERTKLINGTLTIWSEPGKGATLALEVHK
jgi:signal transduction histidine kinase